jgi:transcriptional regulator with XRE-family HTH domain
MPNKAELGRRIREERVRQSLTLKQVESRSGVSATHISQIERGITWPTVNALDKVARALEKNTSFFLEEVELPEVCRTSGDGTKILYSEKPRVELKSLTRGIPGGRLHFYKLVAYPDGEGDGDGDGEIMMHCHEGDECGWVLSGKIEVMIGEDKFELKEGDAIHFNASKQHGIRNVGDGVSESIWAAMSLGL